MMFTTEMIQLFAVVLAKDSERVSEVLLQEGIIQFINTTEIDNRDLSRLSAVSPRASLKEITDLRERVGGLLRAGGIAPAAPRSADLTKRVPIEIEKEKTFFDRIDRERESIRERQRTLQQEILKLEDIRRQVDLYGLGLAELPIKTRHSFLQIQTGKVPEPNIKKLEDGLRDFPSLNVTIGREDGNIYYLLISMKRDSEQIHKVLSRAGWTNIELPNELMSVKKDVFRELSVKLDAFTTEQKQLEQKVVEIMTKHAEHLNQVWANLRMTELLYKIQTYFKSSSRTVIFTGWLPASRRKKLTEEIYTSCSGHCYLEWHEPGDKETLGDDVPVQFNNPKILAPFEMLVSNFGIPQYGTIDPTPFVMPLYLSMYGLMFADVGQGFILVLAGILGALAFRSIPERRGWYTLSWLVIWCGISSVIFGALFGSYFGMALLKPLWFDFHGIISGHHTNDSAVNDLFDILAITLYFGITVIFLGLLFNWINLIRTRKWFELFFDEVGIIGGWIYGSGIYVALYMLRHDYRQLPPANSLFVLIMLPCLLLFFKEPYHYFVQTHHQAQSAEQSPGQQQKARQFNPAIVLMFLLQWIVEILDIFSRYLANTLSFMRVAGLGIAHVSLMISFFTIAGMTSGFFSIVILVLGNILVICLEGLTAGVQALRLSYYEFFTKFFRGSGKLYTPISLSSS